MLAGVAFGSPAALSLSIRNRWPSGDTSYWRGGNGVDVFGVEHLRRLARAERRSGRLDRHRGERIRCIEVEQLATAPRPRGACPARRRDLPAAAVHLRERPHVDLVAPRLTSTGTRGSDRWARTRPTLRRTGSGRMAPPATGSHSAMDPTPVGSRDSPAETRRCRTPLVVLGRTVSKPTTRVPSGVMDVGHCGFALVVSRSTAPVPSAACAVQVRARPSRSDVKMIRRPSGVQSGSPSMPGAKVKRLSVSRAKSQIQMSLFS